MTVLVLVTFGFVARVAGPGSAAVQSVAAAEGLRNTVARLEGSADSGDDELDARYRVRADLDGSTVYAETSDQVEAVAWALGRFAAAGLALPNVEVRYHSDYSGCASTDGDAGTRAGYLAYGGGNFVVYLCGTRFTLLHELAHVWDVSALTDEVRAEFLVLRDADAWSHDTWARAGGEHLADVVAWGLQEDNVRPSRTKPNDDASLYEAYVAATGSEPLS